MLARRDLERIANAQDVELRVVEHDYVITHILAQVRPTAGDVLVFKGGTCLRKV